MIEENYLNTLKVVHMDSSPLATNRVGFLLNDLDRVELCGSAHDMISAMSLVEQQKPNVVILDLDEEEQEQTFNGIEFLVALRQNYPDIILMLLTNNSEPQYRTKCILLGAHYFFNKTNDFGKIPATLKRIMQSN